MATYAKDAKQASASSWRDLIKPHPAAAEFERLPDDELRALGEDIKAHGLRHPIVLWRDGILGDVKAPFYVLDGTSRLDAIEFVIGPVLTFHPSIRTKQGFLKGRCANIIPTLLDNGTDPYAYVASANLHRRHLTAEQRRNLIIRLIERAPEKSDRQIGKEIGADHKTVAVARAQGEVVGRIPHVEARIDSKGRSQPAKRKVSNRQRRDSWGISPESHPQIAKTLGVGPATIDRDVAASSEAPGSKKKNQNNAPASAGASNAAPPAISGQRAAQLVLRRESGGADRLAKVAADEQRVLALQAAESAVTGPDPRAEVERLRAENDQLRDTINLRDLQIRGLEREIAELKAAAYPDIPRCLDRRNASART